MIKVINETGILKVPVFSIVIVSNFLNVKSSKQIKNTVTNIKK